MSKLVIGLFAASAIITVGVAIATASQLTTIVVGGLCIFVTVLALFLIKSSMKKTKGM